MFFLSHSNIKYISSPVHKTEYEISCFIDILVIEYYINDTFLFEYDLRIIIFALRLSNLFLIK